MVLLSSAVNITTAVNGCLRHWDYHIEGKLKPSCGFYINTVVEIKSREFESKTMSVRVKYKNYRIRLKRLNILQGQPVPGI